MQFDPIYITIGKTTLFLFTVLVWWAIGFLGVRYWHQQSGHWQGNVYATRTAFIAGFLAGPLAWPLGFLLHYDVNQDQPTNE